MFGGWTVCSVYRLLINLWLQPCPPLLLSHAPRVSESGAATGRCGTDSLPLSFSVPQPVALLVFLSFPLLHVLSSCSTSEFSATRPLPLDVTVYLDCVYSSL